MSLFLFANFLHYLFGILMFLTSLFLILLILVQRGRGGGLTGALGGMGGQSAFGTKAGDLFTRVTIGAAFVWILLCLGAIKLLNSSSTGAFGGKITTSSRVSGDGKKDKSKDKGAAKESGDSTENSEDVTGATGSTVNKDADTKAPSGGVTGTPAAEATPAAETPAAEKSSAPDADPKGEEKK